MIDLIERACALLDIDPVQVMAYHIDNDAAQVVMVVNKGVAGCPKLTIPLADLSAEEPIEKPAAPEKSKPKRAIRKKSK